jgi:thioredoxin 2
MPVFVDPKACLNREHCFAAAACPYDAYYHNNLKKTWEVDATICGDCPGPCLNFCDQDAVHWGDDLVDLKLVKAQVEGTMKPAEVAEARLKHKQELKAAQEAEKQKSAADVMTLTQKNFESEVLRSQVPVVIDCWAAWCAPCKQFSPIFEAVAKQYTGVVKFAKLDPEAEPALARGLGVQALPTVLMLYKGQLVNAVEGAMPAEHFQAWIYQTLAAIRQYESQLQAEADDAINAATRNVASLDGEQQPPEQAEPPSDLTLDTRATPSPEEKPSKRRPDDRGKQTASGLYVP